MEVSDEEMLKLKEKGVWETLTLHQVPMALKDKFWTFARERAVGNPKAALAMLLEYHEWHERIDDLEQRVIVLEKLKEEPRAAKPLTFGGK